MPPLQGVRGIFKAILMGFLFLKKSSTDGNLGQGRQSISHKTISCKRLGYSTVLNKSLPNSNRKY